MFAFGTLLFSKASRRMHRIRLPKFFRLALGGDKTRLEDMDFLLNETRRLGYNITSAETDE
jgi:hypothetical protein